MKSFILVFISLFFIYAASAEESSHLALDAGLWEGISEESGLEYNLLQINENGEHKLVIAHLASAFRYVKVFPFKNESIACDYSECIISIKNHVNPNENIRLIVTPHLYDSLNVLQISVDKNNKPILTQTYQLDKKRGQSTVREFIERYSNRVTSLDENIDDELFGFWIGVLDIREKKQLVVMDIRRDKRSEFVLMLNGNSFTNETYFNYKDITVEKKITTISTSHKTFANKIMLHHLDKNVLHGHLYSYYKDQALEPSDFKLFRVTNSKFN